MLKGTIIELSYQKGYGFLKELGTNRILRFDLSDQNEGFTADQQIEYNVLDLDPGKMAINLKSLSPKKVEIP